MTLDTHHHVRYCARPAAVAVVGDKGLVLPAREHERQVLRTVRRVTLS